MPLKITRRQLAQQLTGLLGIAASAPLVNAAPKVTEPLSSEPVSPVRNWIIPAYVFEQMRGSRAERLAYSLDCVRSMLPKGHKLFSGPDSRQVFESRDSTGGLQAAYVIVSYDPDRIDQSSGSLFTTDRWRLMVVRETYHGKTNHHYKWVSDAA